MKAKSSYDFIGDVHGQSDKLNELLQTLGYARKSRGWKHPEGRKVVFLGDYIDRGPGVAEVLSTVRAMVEDGAALALMGNHEFNALAYHTPDPWCEGEFLRPHSDKNRKQHGATLEQFRGRGAEWKSWLDWFYTLPLWLDLGGVRAVHACWHPEAMNRLGTSFLDPDLLVKASRKGWREYFDVEILLKGVEVRLPSGGALPDKDGHHRSEIRVKWWKTVRCGLSAQDLIFPSIDFGPDLDVRIEDGELMKIPGYPVGQPPVLIWHYWLPPCQPPRPERANIACVDTSAGKNGPLTAYRWEGEQELSETRFIQTKRDPIPYNRKPSDHTRSIIIDENP